MKENDINIYDAISLTELGYAILAAPDFDYGASNEYEIGLQQEIVKADYVTDFDTSKFHIHTKDEVLQALGRKKLSALQILKPFVDTLKYKTYKDKTTLLHIGQTSTFWSTVYGGQRNVSNLIKIAKKVNLICDYSTNDYKLGYSFNNRLAVCKSYVWNKKVERYLIELFNEYDIKLADMYRNNITNKLANILPLVETFDYEQFNIGNKIRITSKTCWNCPNEWVIKGIFDRYPQYTNLLATLDYCNHRKDIDEMDYAPLTITRSKNDKNVTAVGIRARNQYCNTKVHNVKETDSRSRDELLKEKFNGKYYSYDVKSSIYRITHLLNYGEWLDESVDLYREIAGVELSDDNRNVFKHSICQRLYFSTSSRDMSNKIIRKKPTLSGYLCDINAFSILDKLRENMICVIGKPFDSEIFLHESCIYAEVQKRLIDMGIKVIQVYDGFYTNVRISKCQFDSIVRECAMAYYDTYIR